MNLFEYQRLVLDSCLGASSKLLLVSLSSWASGQGDEEGWSVWPPSSDLEARTSTSGRTLRRVIQGLESDDNPTGLQWLERRVVVKGGKQRALYLLKSTPVKLSGVTPVKLTGVHHL